MKKINIALNGFGRIGVCIMRALIKRQLDNVDIVAINNLSDIHTAAHLLKYDSTHGVLDAEVSVNDNHLCINDMKIPYFMERHATALPWKKTAVDVVLECTGVFASAEKAAAHLQAGAGKVLISAPAAGAELTVVQGVNHDQLRADMRIVSNASCTTNCLAPLAKVLHEAVGIESGLMNTVHSYTNDQNLLDSHHTDIRRARAATASMIPTKTGAAAAIGLVLPALAGKLSGLSVRVPTMNVSLVDFTCLLKREATAAEINDAMQTAAAGALNGILAVNELPLVSVDFNQRVESSVFDATQTQTIGRLAKVFSWYDNEWGFSNRMLDTAIQLGG